MLLVEAEVVADGVVGCARGIPESSREIVVWLRWCWSNFAERAEGVEGSGEGAVGSGRGIDKVGRVLVKVIDEELADVALEKVKTGKILTEDKFTYVVAIGPHILPRCTN